MPVRRIVRISEEEERAIDSLADRRWAERMRDQMRNPELLDEERLQASVKSVEERKTRQREYSRRWREANRGKPEYKARQRASVQKYRNKPEGAVLRKAQAREHTRKWREENKDKPQYKARQRASQKRWLDSNRGNPEYRERHRNDPKKYRTKREADVALVKAAAKQQEMRSWSGGCNEECENARGPRCLCGCYGLNHGVRSGMNPEQVEVPGFSKAERIALGLIDDPSKEEEL